MTKRPLGQYLTLQGSHLGDLESACAHAKQQIRDTATDPVVRATLERLLKVVAWAEDSHKAWEPGLREQIAEKCMAAVMSRVGWADPDTAAELAFECADAFLAARGKREDAKVPEETSE